MPIVNNTANAIGDEFSIKFQPIRGVNELLEFHDATLGETVNRFFKREYAYALRDGLFFTDWVEFTTGSSLNVVFTNPQIVWVKVKYIRTGTDSSGLLTLQSIDIDTDYTAMPEKDMPNTEISIYKENYKDDTQVLQLVQNLLAKFYYRGIVPQYILRGGDNGVGDEDYLSFWRAYIQGLATIIVKNEAIKSFDFDENWLESYLEQFNFFFDKARIDLLQLRFLMRNQYAQIKQRGTEQIFKEQDVLNGEFLRMVGKDEVDEFVYWLDYNENRGWVVGKNSPCFRGADRNKQLNKVSGLSVLRQSTTPPYNANYSILTYLQKEALMIGMVTSGKGALNYYLHNTSPTFTTYEDTFLVDDELDYEVSFFIATDDISQKCAFWLHTFDKDWNYAPAYSVNTGGAGVGNGYFEFSLPSVGKYYYFTVSLYNSNRQDLNPLKTNTNIGTNFALRRGVKHILPSFVFDSLGANKNFYLSDVRINILSKGARLNYEKGLGARSNCFLNSNNLLNIIARNNNGQLSFSNIEQIAKKFLIPYNAHMILDFINRFETETNFGVLPDFVPLGDFNNDFNNDFS